MVKRILVYTPTYVPGHHKRELPIVRELCRRAYQVTYCVAGNVPEFEKKSPGYPQETLSDPEFTDLDTVWISDFQQLEEQLRHCDVLLLGISRGLKRLLAAARSMGCAIVQHDSIGGMDMVELRADLVSVRGPFFREKMIEIFGIPENRIFSTGCVQYDRAVHPDVRAITREDFCSTYGLDPRKDIVVWLPDAPANHDEWMQKKYVEICEIVRDIGLLNLVIKPHPWDYIGLRTGVYLGNLRTWERLAPWATVIRPEDAYKCFNVCEVGVTIQSSVSLEFPLFGRPIIYVDVAESPIVRKFGGPVPSFVGISCSLAELRDVLLSKRYAVRDARLYEEHINRFCFRNDGRAYERIVDLVERACEKGISRFAWWRRVGGFFGSPRIATPKGARRILRTSLEPPSGLAPSLSWD